MLGSTLAPVTSNHPILPSDSRAALEIIPATFIHPSGREKLLRISFIPFPVSLLCLKEAHGAQRPSQSDERQDSQTQRPVRFHQEAATWVRGSSRYCTKAWACREKGKCWVCQESPVARLNSAARVATVQISAIGAGSLAAGKKERTPILKFPAGNFKPWNG